MERTYAETLSEPAHFDEFQPHPTDQTKVVAVYTDGHRREMSFVEGLNLVLYIDRVNRRELRNLLPQFEVQDSYDKRKITGGGWTYLDKVPTRITPQHLGGPNCQCSDCAYIPESPISEGLGKIRLWEDS